MTLLRADYWDAAHALSCAKGLVLMLCCMQALKEVYLPESGIWIAKYPFVDRDVFLDISLDIERERKTQQAAQWPT